MRRSRQIFDISVLPDNAQKEVFDFLQFLQHRYKIGENKKNISKYKFLDNPVKVDSIIIPSREEIHER